MQSDKNILQEKLQKLYNITMEVNEIMPPEEKCSYKWQDFFEECANLRDAFFDIGTEDGIVPDFSEVVPVEIVLSCFIDNCDIPAICANFADNYPEFDVDENSYENDGDMVKFTWTGSVDSSEDAEALIRLTHHAEGIYDGTSAEHVHVEVSIDGTWHGQM